MSSAGGALALVLTSWTAKSFARFIPPNANPVVLNGTVDHNVVGVIVLLSVLASIICGAFPALRSSRVPAAEVLKEESANVSGGSHNRRLLSGLVVAQIALSLALLVTSGLFLPYAPKHQFGQSGIRAGSYLERLGWFGIAGYPDEQVRVIRHKILDRVIALPGVTVASLTDWVPFNFNERRWTRTQRDMFRVRTSRWNYAAPMSRNDISRRWGYRSSKDATLRGMTTRKHRE